MKTVALKMDDIFEMGKSLGWKQPQFNSALRGMLAEERQALRAGNIALNKHVRPWASHAPT
jgi:hypothetical protein